MIRRLRVSVASLVAAVLLAPALPATSLAAPGIYLTWNDCPLAPGSVGDLAGPCVNGGQEELNLSFELDSAAVDVNELDAVIDVQSAAAVLPMWWQYAPSGCRYGQLIASIDFSGRSACTDFWLGEGTFGGPPVYSPGAPHGSPNQARITFSFALLSSHSRALAAGVRYYAARLVFQNDASNACVGCDVATCVLLNSIHLGRVPGTPGIDPVLIQPGAPGSNRATWQGAGADCSAVPVRRHTWGALKTLYR